MRATRSATIALASLVTALGSGCDVFDRAEFLEAKRAVAERHAEIEKKIAALDPPGARLAAAQLLDELASRKITEYEPYRLDPVYQRHLFETLETIYAFRDVPLEPAPQKSQLARITAQCDACHREYEE